MIKLKNPIATPLNLKKQNDPLQEVLLESARKMLTAANGKPQQDGLSKRDSLSKVAMQAIEARLERNPILTRWDILIRPA